MHIMYYFNSWSRKILNIKDYSSIQFNLLSSSNMIQTQYKRPAFTTPPSNETARIYKCDLCNTFFRTDEELSDHVKTNLFNKREQKLH
jgi:hypothetical protein